MTPESTPGPRTRPPAALPVDRAFLVQFRPGPVGGPAWQPAGRVEHLESGRAARFGDWAGLRAFIERVLAHPDPGPPGDNHIPRTSQPDES